MPPSQTDLKTKLESLLEKSVQKVTSLSGGCSYPSYIVKTDPTHYFVKTHDEPTQVFEFESTGLTQLKKHYPYIPKIYNFSNQILTLEFIETEEPKKDFWVSLGLHLAELHKIKMPSYGFYEDNMIGLAQQKNSTSLKNQSSWSSFFWENRIEFKLAQIKSRHQFDLGNEQHSKLKRTIIKQLEEHEPHPSLVHGDLWSGNILCGLNQKPYLIDPAVYYGDREADIAMTECFGGFSEEFYQSYNKVYPLEKGYENRKHIYNLYHMLNHFLIFGEDYRSSCLSIIKLISDKSH